MKIYFLRHGTTIWNVEGRLQGRNDSDLTEEGINRAIRLRNKLEDVKFDLIYSSPQKRALETANIIRGNRDAEITIHEALYEIDFGDWEGMKIPDIEREFSKEFHTFMAEPEKYHPTKGESFVDLFKRVQEFLDEIKNLNNENILVVTHGATIKAMLTIIKGLNINQISNIPVYTGTALNICEISKGKMELLVEGDTSHI